MIKVLICDDQTIICEGLRLILETDPQIAVVATARHGQEALDLIPQHHPQLVLMDLKMPVMNGIQATRLIRTRHPQIKVLVLTTYDADEWVFDAIRSGAAGYLLKDSPREALLAAVKGTVAGKTHIDPAVAGKLLDLVTDQPVPAKTSIADTLSDRERSVLALLGQGLTNTQIAKRLHLSQGTVRNYVSTIFSKLDVSDRTQAALIALQYDLTLTNSDDV